MAVQDASTPITEILWNGAKATAEFFNLDPLVFFLVACLAFCAFMGLIVFCAHLADCCSKADENSYDIEMVPAGMMTPTAPLEDSLEVCVSAPDTPNTTIDENQEDVSEQWEKIEQMLRLARLEEPEEEIVSGNIAYQPNFSRRIAPNVKGSIFKNSPRMAALPYSGIRPRSPLTPSSDFGEELRVLFEN